MIDYKHILKMIFILVLLSLIITISLLSFNKLLYMGVS